MNRSLALIAVVDDDESIRKALDRLLRSAQFEVETFASGLDFLEWLDGHKPDCVVLDLHMPGITGFDVQARLAERGGRIPAVIITGHDSPEAHARATAGGAASYLRKPVEEKTLLKAIADAMGEGRKDEKS